MNVINLVRFGRKNTDKIWNEEIFLVTYTFFYTFALFFELLATSD